MWTLVILGLLGTGPPKGYICGRALTPIVVDGKLDDKVWADAPWTDAFVDIEGDKKPNPRFRTRAKMLWDDQYFYIAAQLDEPHVWGTLTKRDSVIFADPDFEVFIDPDGDNHQYYEFEINALNTGWDLRLPKPYKDGGSAIDAWDILGIKTAVHIDGTINDPSDIDQGWSVEIAIPWKALGEFTPAKSPPSEGDQWRVNFSRVQWLTDIKGKTYQKVPKTKEDNWVWSPQGVVDMHRPETWGYVQFTEVAAADMPFKPDVDRAAKDFLHSVYYAQRDHFARSNAYAKTIEELVLKLPEGLSDPIIRIDDKAFTVDVTTAPKAGDPHQWSIASDAKLTRIR